MLKIVVYDSGYGGELFADRIEADLPIVEVIRVIDWRNSELILKSAKEARRVAESALEPYIGDVDLIVFANHLLTLTSLRYFKRKYKNQKFTGFTLKRPVDNAKLQTLILTTHAVSRSMGFYNYLFGLRRNFATLCLDEWPELIDDGELSDDSIRNELTNFITKNSIHPAQMVLGCGQFSDIKPALRKALGSNIKIYDSFDDTMDKICKILKLRGGVRKKK